MRCCNCCCFHRHNNSSSRGSSNNNININNGNSSNNYNKHSSRSGTTLTVISKCAQHFTLLSSDSDPISLSHTLVHTHTHLSLMANHVAHDSNDLAATPPCCVLLSCLATNLNFAIERNSTCSNPCRINILVFAPRVEPVNATTSWQDQQCVAGKVHLEYLLQAANRQSLLLPIA